MSSTTTNDWRLGYRPALDGLRGIAVALVLINHTGLPYTGTAGTVGVNVFFVLSGFLITRLLIEERDTHGSISLSYFYKRRALRIFPAMYVYLAATAVVAVAFREPLSQVVYAGTYVANLVRAGGTEMPLMPHTWSLAMEEQFYVIWPVLLAGLLATLVASRRFALTSIVSVGIVLSFGTRIVLGLSDASLMRLHNGPDLAAGVLLVGCLLALWADRFEGSLLARPSAWALGMVAILATSLGDKSVSFYLVWLPLAIGGSALVIAYLAQDTRSGWVHRSMTMRPLLYLGKISYGLYLWHYTVYFIVKKNVTSYPAKPLLQISLSLVVATLSYYLLERRFLKMKDGMRQMNGVQQGKHATPPDPATVVGAGAPSTL